VSAQLNAYFETSAIVKLILVEIGSSHAYELWDESIRVVTSRLAYAEARAALSSAHRTRRVSAAALQTAKLELDARFHELALLEATEGVLRRAGDLAERHALRGFDAIHLSSATELDRRTTLLVTWDRDLARAGREEGLAIAGASL